MATTQIKTKKVKGVGRPRKYAAKYKMVRVSVPLVTHAKHTWQAYAHAVGKSMTDFVVDAVTSYINDERNMVEVTTRYKENIKQFSKGKIADL